MNAESVALSAEADAIVRAHAERTGLTLGAALEDLVRRGAAQVDVREIRDAVDEIRAKAEDTYQALDALAPYAIAALGVMAHWGTRSGSANLGEVEYAEAALDTARATWDGQTAARGLALPIRPAAEQPLAPLAERP